MKIILTNGTELQPILVTGGPEYVQGTNRDVLTFVFADESMDKLNSLFTETNCESIKIVGDDKSEAIHQGYTIRAAISKNPEEIEPATTDIEAVYEERVSVKMAQRTYYESKLASLQDELTYTQLALCEVYETKNA